MALNYKIYDFPNIGIERQLFYAGGMSVEGGFTSGGARVSSGPEPGGRAFLDMQLSLQVKEWENPIVSWLMTMLSNGAIFRIQLAKTPQVVTKLEDGEKITEQPWFDDGLYGVRPWDNGQFWAAEVVSPIITTSLIGSKVITVNTSAIGQSIKHGHVIGIGDSSYLVEDIRYQGDTATITLNPPLRKTVNAGSLINLLPYFLGSVANISEFRITYDRAQNGHIQPGRLQFHEVIL